MDLTEENKAHIDGLTYGELLTRWRFAPAGDVWFQGETGDYWAERMKQMRAEGADHVGASKAAGWER